MGKSESLDTRLDTAFRQALADEARQLQAAATLPELADRIAPLREMPMHA